MPISVKNAPLNPASGPHAEAAAEMVSETTKTKTEAGNPDPVDQSHEMESEPISLPHPYEVLELGMSFKMPVASYTMLEFSVRRSVPYSPLEEDPDEVFGKTKQWVEDKLNGLIAEQQTGDEG